MRNIPLFTEEIYHVFNRGVEKRIIFNGSRDYFRFLETIDHYRFRNQGRLSNKSKEDKSKKPAIKDEPIVEIIAYCLMPNHFHILLKQKTEGGISEFMGNIQNSYTRYFNVKNDRVGSLFQGTFKAVRIENDDQLMHVSRYIHMNPYSVKMENINNVFRYAWSSILEYERTAEMCEIQTVLELFKNGDEYIKFCKDLKDNSVGIENKILE